MTPYVFLIPHAETVEQLRNKILLNIVSNGIMFLFLLFPYMLLHFLHIYHRLAIFIIKCFEVCELEWKDFLPITAGLKHTLFEF